MISGCLDSAEIQRMGCFGNLGRSLPGGIRAPDGCSNTSCCSIARPVVARLTFAQRR